MGVLSYLRDAWPWALLGSQWQAKRKDQNQETGGNGKGLRRGGTGPVAQIVIWVYVLISTAVKVVESLGTGGRSLLTLSYPANLRKD